MNTADMAQEMVGQSFNEARQQLGDPATDTEFKLGTQVSEFRIELTNFFDETERSQTPPTIREATWSRGPEQNLTLWFSKAEGGSDWKVVHFLTWHPEDQF